MPHDSTDANPASTSAAPPDGYLPLSRSSPFLDLVGPLFYRPSDTGFSLGLRVLEQHLNSVSTLHGGLIATLADVSLGYVTAFSCEPMLSMVTASLTIDYLDAAALGSWVESHVTVNKVGKHLAFADAALAADGRPVAKARALFAIADRAQPAAGLTPQDKKPS